MITYNNSPIPPGMPFNERHVLNIIINANTGNLAPVTKEKIAIWCELDKKEIEQAVNELAKKQLIDIWV